MAEMCLSWEVGFPQISINIHERHLFIAKSLFYVSIMLINKCIRILGTRGLPAQHGGFETFAQYLSLYLVEKGWSVIVYCQDDSIDVITEQTWRGIQLIKIPVSSRGAVGSMVFDWKSIWHAKQREGVILTLGYNTAIFCLWLKINNKINLINMDGIEWKRQKWPALIRLWFYINEYFGCWLGDHLIADHPEIKKHLMRRVSEKKITVIAYGAEPVTLVNENILNQYGLTVNEYLLVIARPEPENSIFEIVAGFCAKGRSVKLVILGEYIPQQNKYHKKVVECATADVLFLGAIYDNEIVQALRSGCRLYIHGHQVGGTNPSLVEALGAGSAVVAHDNHFNRWVAGEQAKYFSNQQECNDLFDNLLANEQQVLSMQQASRRRFLEAFTWDRILNQYEALLIEYAASSVAMPKRSVIWSLILQGLLFFRK